MAQTLITDPSLSLAWLVAPVDDSGDGELADAACVALGTDRLADASDSLPDPNDGDRRGWWGDLDAALLFDGWPIGCRLWLLAREKITGPAAQRGATIARIDSYIREAFQPFLARRIATRLQVDVTRADLERIDASITLYRGPAVLVDLRFTNLWARIAP